MNFVPKTTYETSPSRVIEHRNFRKANISMNFIVRDTFFEVYCVSSPLLMFQFNGGCLLARLTPNLPWRLVTSDVLVHVVFVENITYLSRFYRNVSYTLIKEMNDASMQLQLTEWKIGKTFLIIITPEVNLSIHGFSLCLLNMKEIRAAFAWARNHWTLQTAHCNNSIYRY